MCGLGLARKPRLGPSLRGPTAWVEVRPSQSHQRGLGWAWPGPGLWLLRENLPKLLIFNVNMTEQLGYLERNHLALIEFIATSREELTYVPHNTGVTMGQRRSEATVNEGQWGFVCPNRAIDRQCLHENASTAQQRPFSNWFQAFSDDYPQSFRIIGLKDTYSIHYTG